MDVTPKNLKSPFTKGVVKAMLACVELRETGEINVLTPAFRASTQATRILRHPLTKGGSKLPND